LGSGPKSERLLLNSTCTRRLGKLLSIEEDQAARVSPSVLSVWGTIVTWAGLAGEGPAIRRLATSSESFEKFVESLMAIELVWQDFDTARS